MTKRQSEWNKRKHEIHRNIQATIVLVILHQCNRLNQLHQLSPRRLIILENACDIKYTRLSTSHLSYTKLYGIELGRRK